MAAHLTNDNESNNIEKSRIQMENSRLLRPPSPDRISKTTFVPFPQTIIKSIETMQKQRFSHSRSACDVQIIQQSSIDTTNDDIDDNYDTTTTTTTTNSSRKRLLVLKRTQQLPSDIRIALFSNKKRSSIESNSFYTTEIQSFDQSLNDIKPSTQNRIDNLRRTALENRLNRRIHSSLPTSALRFYTRQRSSASLNRRHPYFLPKQSKWHFVRNHLTDIAMMNDTYARMKLVERDFRWIHLRDEICKQVLEMREMSILRQQEDGTLKKSAKTSIDLKSLPVNEVVYVEHDGQIYSMGMRDLVLGRAVGDQQMQLDTWVQLEARRIIRVKQNLLKQQEGRTRLKRQIAFSFFLCNLSLIVFMFIVMFIFVTTTIFELRKSRELF